MKKNNIEVTTRRGRIGDIPEPIACSRRVYADYPPEYTYTERHYEMQLKAFPDGQFVAVADGKIVGYATSIIVNIDDHYWYTVEKSQAPAPSAPTTPTATRSTARISAFIPITGGAVLPCCSTSGGGPHPA